MSGNFGKEVGKKWERSFEAETRENMGISYIYIPSFPYSHIPPLAPQFSPSVGYSRPCLRARAGIGERSFPKVGTTYQRVLL